MGDGYGNGYGAGGGGRGVNPNYQITKEAAGTLIAGESGGGGAVAFLRMRGLGLGTESVSLRLLTLCRGWSLIMVGARLTLSNWEMESHEEYIETRLLSPAGLVDVGDL